MPDAARRIPCGGWNADRRLARPVHHPSDLLARAVAGGRGGADDGRDERGARRVRGGGQSVMMDLRRDWVVGLEAARVPARCVDVELSEPLTDLAYPDYRSVHALVRLHGTPVGVVSVPLVDGRCEAAMMRSAIIDRLAPALIQVAVRHAIERPISATPLNADRLIAEPPLPNDALPGVTVAVCTRDR